MFRPADNHAALADELASARQKYETKKENVLARAQSRLTAVNETQRELAEEAVRLDGLIKTS